MSLALIFLRRLGLLATAACLVGGAGCMHPGPYDPARKGPFFTPRNVISEGSLGGIRRVVVLPAWSGNPAFSDSAAEVDNVILSALQQHNRFEVVTLTRAECQRRFNVDALASTAALPQDLMGKLKREFAADAVLFIDLTVFEPYRPLAVGFRAKLATLENTRIVWAFDDVFSADKPAVANAARHASLDRDTAGVPADLTSATLQSPSRFAAYAANAMFDTLPSVTMPLYVGPAPATATAH